MQFRAWAAALAIGATALTGLICGTGKASAAPAARPIPVKVMIVTMFGPEGDVWLKHLPLTQTIPVPGLSTDYPDVHCTTNGICLVTTGMGHANAAASIAVLAFSRQFDFRKTYWIVTGIAGVSPRYGTLGSAAWARYLVEWDLQWALDAREAPKAWPTGYAGINTGNPDQKPSLDYGTEVFALNQALVARAYALSKTVTLADNPEAAKTRAAYPAPANQPPAVIACDTLSGDTWWSGTDLAGRADTWTKLLTDGQGRYCTNQQEDNATYAALTRATAAGLADDSRVAVLRAGSDFDQPPPGGSDVSNLLDYGKQGGFPIALENLYRAADPLVQAIATHWADWEKGVPK